MRIVWCFVVGTTAFGCKDKPVAKAADQKSPVPDRATPGSSTPAAPQRPPDPPTLQLDHAFEAEAVDAGWAAMTETSIHAVAPHLTDVTCRKLQCRVTLWAATWDDMVNATEQLQSESSLRGIDGARAVILTRPDTRDGKLAMTIYVRFDRE